jgi:UDP-N-acetylmuramate dehydrogenase
MIGTGSPARLPGEAPPVVAESFDVPLSSLTTLRLGGPARRVVTCRSEAAVIEAVRAAAAAGEEGGPVLVLGGGSNLVAADAGFPGTVVRVATRGITVESLDACSGATVRVAAGEPWEDVVARTVAEGWVGMEALAGIPGLTGATPIQNVGAYGQDVAQTITRVRTWDRELARVRTFSHAECAFTYRHSIFKGASRWVVLDVTFQLRLGSLGAPVRYGELARALGIRTGERAPLAAVRAAVLELRAAKGMVLDPEDPDTYSAGSFFTNPVLEPEQAAGLPADAPRFPEPDGRVKTSAAWLIERAGFGKGYGRGAARLSTKHTLALTNRGGATTAELLALAREIRAGVRERFGVELVNEPVLLGVQL